MLNSSMRNLLTEAFADFDLMESATIMEADDEEKEYDGIQTFDYDNAGVDELNSFLDTYGADPDAEENEPVEVVDMEAEDENDIKQSYIGKVIVDCNTCHGNIYLNPDELTVNEDGESTFDGECPYCMSDSGFTVIGEVQPYEPGVDAEDMEDELEDDEDIDIDAMEEEPVEDELPEEDEEFEESLNLTEMQRYKKETGETYPEWASITGPKGDHGTYIDLEDDLSDMQDDIINLHLNRKVRHKSNDDILNKHRALRRKNESFADSKSMDAVDGLKGEKSLHRRADNIKEDDAINGESENAKKIVGTKTYKESYLREGFDETPCCFNCAYHYDDWCESLDKKVDPDYCCSEFVSEDDVDYDDFYENYDGTTPQTEQGGKDAPVSPDFPMGKEEPVEQTSRGGKPKLESLLKEDYDETTLYDLIYDCIDTIIKGNPDTVIQEVPGILRDVIYDAVDEYAENELGPTRCNENLNEARQSEYKHTRGKSTAYEKYTDNVEYEVSSNVDGKICKCIDLADAKATIKEMQAEDRKDPERKGKVKYSYKKLTEGIEGRPTDKSDRYDVVYWLADEYARKYDAGDPHKLMDEIESMHLSTVESGYYEGKPLEEMDEMLASNEIDMMEFGGICDLDYIHAMLTGDDEWFSKHIGAFSESLEENLSEKRGIPQTAGRGTPKVSKDAPKGKAKSVPQTERGGKAMAEAVTLDTMDDVTVTQTPNGGVSVTSEPAEAMMDNMAEIEMIAPISDEVEAELPPEALPIEDEEPMMDEPQMDEIPMEEPIEDFDEEEFDGLGESYFREAYANVESFKTNSVRFVNESLIVEGTLTFNSGKSGRTSFNFKPIFAKNGAMVFEGYNTQINASTPDAFIAEAHVQDKKLVFESLNYKYNTVNNLNESVEVSGTVTPSK